jgi:peptide/nickel transport system substrate-binding protein
VSRVTPPSRGNLLAHIVGWGLRGKTQRTLERTLSAVVLHGSVSHRSHSCGGGLMSGPGRIPGTKGDYRQPIYRRPLLRSLGGGVALALTKRLQRFAVACAASTLQDSILLVGANFVLRGLDPARTIESTGAMINHATYDTLVTFDGEDLRTLRSSLAAGWKISDDGRSLAFALRPNIRFNSGNALTATDVKWSFDRVMHLQANASFLLNGVEEVLAPDPHTVILRLKAPKTSVLPTLCSPSLGVLDSKIVAERGGDAGSEASKKDEAETYLNARSAGSGPYILTNYISDQEVVLVKNPYHWRGWRGAAPFDRIVVRNIAESATQALLLGKGDLDIATGLGQEQARALRGTSGVTVRSSPVATTFYIVMNMNPNVGGPFANPRVRQAVRYALDYRGILALAGPEAVRLAGLMPTALPGALASRDAVTTDRGRARTLLSHAGLGEIRGQLSYASDLTIRGVRLNLLAQKIQADLATVGISLDLHGLPISTALQQYRNGKFQIGVWNWPADYPDASDFLVYLPGEVIGKRAGWLPDSSPAAQRLIEQANEAESQQDAVKRAALYQQVDKALAEVGPYVPLFQPAAPYAFRSNLRGVTFNSMWGPDFFSIRRSA